MRTSNVLAQLRAGQPVRIAHLSNYLPMFIAVAARTGYDCVWIDLEHNPMSTREVQALLAFCHLYDIDAMVRPGTKDKIAIYRLLEDGATGLLMPHITDADDARDLVNAAKFPPVGDRGIEGFGLESNFFLDIESSTFELVEHAQRETFLFLQIETPDALANVDRIAATPGVDGLYIGPFDLQTRLQALPEDQRPTITEVMQRVAEAARTHGIAWGSFTLAFDQIQAQHELGAQLLIWGGDQTLILNGMKVFRDELDGLLAE